MSSFETSSQCRPSGCSSTSHEPSGNSTMTMVLSPDKFTSDDDVSDDTFSNFDAVPCNPNLGFDLEIQQEDVDRPSAPKPLYSEDLRQIFLEYEKLLQKPAEKRERRISSDHDGVISKRGELEPAYQIPTDPKTSVFPGLPGARKRRPKILRGKAGRVKKNIAPAASRPSRKKGALASKNQEYEFMHLGDVRQTTNGSVEVEVFWAPMFLTCDQLRGEQALEEAKDLVVKTFGQATWDKEESRVIRGGWK